MEASDYKPFDLEHLPPINVLVNWNEGSGLITGWFFDEELNTMFISIGGKNFTAQEAFKKCYIEDHIPCGYKV